MSNADVAVRVRRLLEGAGLSQRDLAESLNMDPDKLSKSLSGVRRFTSLELAKVAERFEVTVNDLLGLAQPTAATAARRAGSHVRTDPAQQQISSLAEVRASMVEVGIPNHVPHLDYGDEPIWISQGERLAEQAHQLLEKWDASLEPGKYMDSIENVFNVDVVLLDLENGCDGLSWRRGSVAVIAAGVTGLFARQRFTLAHELCHALVGDSQDLHVDENVYQTRREPSEIRANSFAACFLLPESTLRFDSRTSEPSDKDFASMVMEYGVSPSTLSYRLLNLQLLDSDAQRHFGQLTVAQCARLTDRAGDLSQWVTKSATPRPPQRLLRDTLAAYFDGRSTLRAFSRVAGVPTASVRAAIDSASSGDEQVD